MLTRARWIARLPTSVLCFVALCAPAALARIGGGESFDSGNSSSDSGGDASFIVEILIWLIIENPYVGIPVTIMVGLAFFFWKRSQDGDSSTRKAIDRADTERRTSVSASAVDGWVSALKAKDPHFDLMKFFDRTRREFLELQDAWFKRNLEPVRKYLSDATFQRLVTQLKLMDLLGVRDAIADPAVLDLQIIGLEQENIIVNAVRLSHTLVRNVMVRKSGVQFLRVGMSLERNLAQMGEHLHTRYPLCAGDKLDTAVGIVNVKKLLATQPDATVLDRVHIAQPTAYISENLTLLEAMREMIRNRQHMMLARDTHGDVTGLITIEDINSELVGYETGPGP